MKTLLDTNILARMAQPGHAMYREAVKAVEVLQRRGDELLIATQSLFELYVVATRPGEQNGFGMTISEARVEIDRVSELFSIIPEMPGTFTVWRSLLDRYTIMGKTAHDARLIALMIVNEIPSILTFNNDDFIRYGEIKVMSPKVLAQTGIER